MDSASNLIPLIQLRLKGAPEYLCNSALRKVISQICRQTDCWRKSIPFVVSSIESTIDEKIRVEMPDPGYEAEYARLFRVFIEEYDADSAEFDDAYEIPAGSYRVKRGETTQIEFDDEEAVAVEDRLTLDVALVPLEIGATLNEIPVGIVQMCGEAAVHLAIADLMLMPGRAWSSPETAGWERIEGMNALRQIIANLDNGSTAEVAKAPVSGIIEG